MYRLLFINLLVAWLTVNTGVALALQEPPELTVSLHDVANVPLAGVAVIVRDASGSQTLAQATTDANGAATFAHLMESQVRVVIVGTLPNGTKLYQPGNDATGISFLLNPLPATLALRSAADGMIVPDPAAMAREPGIPIATTMAAIPTALIAPTMVVAQVGASPSVEGSASATTAVTDTSIDRASSEESGQVWFGIAALIVLISAGIGIVVVQRREQ